MDYAESFPDQEFAEKDNPEFRLGDDNIEEVYNTFNQPTQTYYTPIWNQNYLRPWGAREFAIT